MSKLQLVILLTLTFSCIAKKINTEKKTVIWYYSRLDKPMDSIPYTIKSTIFNDSNYSFSRLINGIDSSDRYQYSNQDTFRITNSSLYKKINHAFIKLIDTTTNIGKGKLIYSYYDIYFKSYKNYYLDILEIIRFGDDSIYKFSLGGDNYNSEDLTYEYFSFENGFVRKDIFNFLGFDKFALYQKVIMEKNRFDTIKIDLQWKK